MTAAQTDKTVRILLMGHDDEFARTLAKRLRRREFECVFESDWERALELVKNTGPDVVIFEPMASGSGGIEGLSSLKGVRRDVAIIILTGHGFEPEMRLAASLGAFAYLQKPTEMAVLCDTVRHAAGSVGI